MLIAPHSYIGTKRILYAKKFVSVASMLANPALAQPIDELYLDNKFAGATLPNMVFAVARRIAKISR